MEARGTTDYLSAGRIGLRAKRYMSAFRQVKFRLSDQNWH